MAERCGKDTSIATGMPVSELREIFPGAISAATAARLMDFRGNGVIILDAGSMRIVKMRGPCPNFENGECRAGTLCLAKHLSKQSSTD